MLFFKEHITHMKLIFHLLGSWKQSAWL